MTQQVTLDELRFDGGWVKAVKGERYFLETEKGQFVVRSEAQLRAEFLKRVGETGHDHREECTGWCQCEVLDLARAARSAMERTWAGFPRMYCENASAALALILRRRGYLARVVQGWVKLKHPIELDGEMYDRPTHQWVEATGLWIDLTADQFDPGYGPVRFYEAGQFMGWQAEGVPSSLRELEGDPYVLDLVDSVAGPAAAQDDAGDVAVAYERYRAAGRDGWGLTWYLAWEFCRRFYASHGIVPHVLEHEGLGYYGIGLDTVACGVHGQEKTLGRFTMSGCVENWKANTGVPHMVERALSGEPLPFLVRDAVQRFGLLTYPDKSHLNCRHKRWGDSYVLMFQIAALIALRHEGKVKVWNHLFHTEHWGRKHDPLFGQKEHPGYFLFEPHAGRRVLVAGDGRLIMPFQSASLWERYMEGESVEHLARWTERLLLL